MHGIGYSRISLLLIAIVTVSHTRRVKRVAGGDFCYGGEYPFVVSISINNKHKCGGSIISEKHILTAAHCISYINNPARIRKLRVITGSIYYNKGDRHLVDKIIYHQEFRAGPMPIASDIGIIKLLTEIQFNNYQYPINLPSSHLPTGVVSVALGWGYINAHRQVSNSFLKQVRLVTIELSECAQRLELPVFTYHICAMAIYGNGLCNGDSGGPLVYNNEIIGIASFGIPCGIGYPDVFTNVYLYKDWIINAMFL